MGTTAIQARAELAKAMKLIDGLLAAERRGDIAVDTKLLRDARASLNTAGVHPGTRRPFDPAKITKRTSLTTIRLALTECGAPSHITAPIVKQAALDGYLLWEGRNVHIMSYAEKFARAQRAVA